MERNRLSEASLIMRMVTTASNREPSRQQDDRGVRERHLMENNDILSFNPKTEQFHVKTAPQSVERKPTPNASNLASAPADNNAPIVQQPDVDFVERLTQHLSELNSVVDSFQNDHGKVAAELQAAQTEVNR